MSENSQSQVGEPWNRIAAELRAVQEDQKELLAGLSDELLDRYFRGKATNSDQEQVQQAVEADPELREALEALSWALSEPADLPGEIPSVPSPLFAGRINCGTEPTDNVAGHSERDHSQKDVPAQGGRVASRFPGAIEQPKPARRP